VTSTPLTNPRQRTRKLPGEADPISDFAEQRSTRMRDQALSVRRDIYREIAPIALHLQGEPPESMLQASNTRRIAAQADSSAAPTIGAATASCTIRVNMARLFDPQVNRARWRLGLPAVRNAFFSPVDSGQPYLVIASPAVIDRPADWPQNVTLTGFVTWDRGSSFPNPDGLEEFLSVPDPPVLVTLGASSSLDPQHFYRGAATAVTSLGRRALVLTGPTPTPVELPAEPGIFTTTFAPLSRVASRCQAAIHGGVGTRPPSASPAN
jgi:UDP:flavonoid glycosyltransferase YjiC (YdhE family)